MSDLPDSPAPAEETPAEHIAAVQKKKNLYRRITSSMPLVVTVIVHVLLIGGAAAIVVQQSGGGKKKTFEASNQSESVNKQVEHRLQVARRGGASSASQSPVSANRIFSTSETALQMPAMPDLPSMGAGGFGGFGGMGSGVGLGAGSGMSTSLGGGTGLGGRGFMSLSFLGSTSQNASNIVFVVDTSAEIMEPRKGGFRAFAIIREEIMRLVGRLPPSAKFNVMLFGYDSGNEDASVTLNSFKRELSPATSEVKKEFFAWMSPVNATFGRFGPSSAASRLAVRAKPLPESAGVDPLFLPPFWGRAVQVALEQQPDTIYVITASGGRTSRRVSEDDLEKRRAEQKKELEDFDQEMKKIGLEGSAVRAARDRAHTKASGELAALNRKFLAEKKEPIVVRWIGELERPDIQAALRKNGASLRLDGTGWTDKDGKRISVPYTRVISYEQATWNDFYAHYARVQRALVPERPTLNLFLFVGPDEKPAAAITNLTAAAKRNGGSFQLLTTKRLEEIKAKEDAAAK